MPMRRLIIVVLLLVSTAPILFADIHFLRIRPLDPCARLAFDAGSRRSELFRALVDRLDRSDLIVYVRTTASLPRGLDGQLQFAVAVEGVRYLRVSLRRDLRPDRQIAVLGHELMHAVEVAGDSSVRDRAAFRALYMRIGHSEDGRTFDTSAAMAAGARVLVEVSLFKTGPRTAIGR